MGKLWKTNFGPKEKSNIFRPISEFQPYIGWEKKKKFNSNFLVTCLSPYLRLWNCWPIMLANVSPTWKPGLKIQNLDPNRSEIMCKKKYMKSVHIFFEFLFVIILFVVVVSDEPIGAGRTVVRKCHTHWTVTQKSRDIFCFFVVYDFYNIWFAAICHVKLWSTSALYQCGILIEKKKRFEHVCIFYTWKKIAKNTRHNTYWFIQTWGCRSRVL